PGRQYQVILSPQIKEADVQALYATYEDFIEKCCQVLDKSWSENASDEWDRFLRMGSAGQYAAVFLRAREGLTDGFLSILDDVRRIYKVICGLLDYELDNMPDDLREQMETLKQADEAYLKACLIANDEIFLFLVFYTLRPFFRMLAPTQLAETVGERVGRILFDVVVGSLLTGGAGLRSE